MKPGLGDWTIDRVNGAPKKGMPLPGPVHEHPDSISQSSHWLCRLAGPGVLTSIVGLVWAIGRFAEGFPRYSDTPYDLGTVIFLCLLAAPILVTIHARYPARWEVERRTGQATLCLGGWPFTRCWTFPLSTITSVRLVRRERAVAGRFHGEVVLDLVDDTNNAAGLTLAHYAKVPRAQRAA